MSEELLRKLKIRAFHITEVKFDKKTSINGNSLFISKDVIEDIRQEYENIKELKVSIVDPDKRDISINTIMDIVPISTKVLGNLGDGITHTLTGVYVIVTGKDESDRQMAAFGSSDGILSERIAFGKAGTPKNTDIIIHIDALIEGAPTFDRNLPNSIISASDKYIQIIRECLKELDGRNATEEHIFYDKFKKGKKRVLITKLVAGQGACYDNRLFSSEPSGFLGGRSIIDMGNVPILLTPNEYRDGAIRALT